MTWGRRFGFRFTGLRTPKPTVIASILLVPRKSKIREFFRSNVYVPAKKQPNPMEEFSQSSPLHNTDLQWQTRTHPWNRTGTYPLNARDSPSHLCPLGTEAKGILGPSCRTQTSPHKGDIHSHTYRLPLRLAVQPACRRGT